MSASDRKEFINKLPKYVNKKSIVGGDFNWVPDKALDQERADGSTCHNEHAAAGEQALLRGGVEDAFRLVRGSNAREYTRLTNESNRRLDRLYAPKYNSDWRWLSIRAHPTAFRRRSDTASDHLAVIAEVETVSYRPPKKSERRVNPRIFKDGDVRSTIRTILSEFHSQHTAELGVQKGWAKTKAVCAEYLLDKSYERHRNTEEEELKMDICMLYKAATSSAPKPSLQGRIKEKEAELERVRKRKKTSRYFEWISAQGEEVSSKKFYIMFKRKWSNADISSLYITPSWEDPEQKRKRPTQDGDTIAEEAKRYYEWLFRGKPSVNPDRMLKLLAKRKLRTDLSSSLEKGLEESEVRTAIRALGKGKSPGPDNLPGEFYQEFEVLLTPILLEVFIDIHEKGMMEEDIRSGDIFLLYKKEDPRELRNYRPITLLQVDYKIRAKILVSRLKPAMDDIVHRAQLGFVPGRSITDGTHLLKLVQAFIDETAGEGLIVAADWEKAFDRVSWEYLEKAMKALGFGPQAQKWVNVMYNPQHAPTRRLKMNGVRSDPFPILSGFPQDCPSSPLIFLLVAEALTRAIEEEPAIRGINVHGTEIKITQFADDTQLILSGYKSLRAMWRVLAEYESATAMRANVKEFEGLRCGRLKSKPVPIIKELKTNIIKWPTPGQSVRVLGIPFWEGGGRDSFMETLYSKTKALIATWTDHAYLTLMGRNMIANAMIYSRFRYVCYTMSMPSHVSVNIQEDVEALIWDRDAQFEADEEGTQCSKRRWMRREAQYASRKLKGGAGMLHWGQHLKAIMIKQLLSYCDATQGSWKAVLDHWLGSRFEEGRGVIFSTTPLKVLTSSSTGRESQLPRFWRKALEALRELNFELEMPGKISQAGALSLPFWSNPLFSVPDLRTKRVWRDTLELRTVKDTFKEDGTEYSEAEILNYIAENLHTEEDNVRVARGVWTNTRGLLREWKVLSRIPDYIKEPARGRARDHRYSSAARSMMVNLGWREGQGLGARGQGRSDLVEEGPSGQGREGLGYIGEPSEGRAKHRK